MQVDREVEQIQQMFNMEEDNTLSQMLIIDTKNTRQGMNIIEAREYLNL